MYCKLCGKHLYEHLGFKNIFKMNYKIHLECENMVNKNEDYNTYPFLDKLIMQDYIFEEKFDGSDEEFLYQKYIYVLYERMLENNDWSIVVILSKKMTPDTVVLITKLAEKAVLFMSVFNENVL